MNYIPEPIKTVSGVKDKILNLFRIKTTEDYNTLKRVKNLLGG